MSGAAPPPAAPRYGTASLAELLPAAVRTLRGGADALLPWPAGLRALVVLVADGLGHRQLRAHAQLAPFLANRAGAVLDAPFPTTTSTSLTTIGTARPPGEHGIVGFAVREPVADRRLVTLTWSWDRFLPVVDARAEVVPERFQPHPTALESAARTGIRATTVLHPDFPDSGLTRAALRGGRVVTAVGLEPTLTAAVGAAAGPGPALVYAHHGAIDTAGHEHGPGSDAWCAALAALDGHLARLAADLPDDVGIVVTADHGMVATPPHELVELTERPELLDGVRLLAGEPRARQLHVTAGAAADVAAAWREDAGVRAHVLTRDGAVDAGWFGPSVTREARDRIGDVIVVPVDRGGWVHRDIDPLGGRLAGHHGALTRDEVEVPALLVTRTG